MRNTTWVPKLKGQRVAVEIPGWLADKHGLPDVVTGDLRQVTARAIGLDSSGTGEVVWLPLSQVIRIERL